MKKIVIGPSVNLKNIRKLESAYNRAIRMEENASSLDKAWRLAQVSAKAFRTLQLARNGETPTLPRTPRNLGKAGLQVLANIGKVIARAVKAQLALAKAKLASVAKAAARKVRRSLRSAVLGVLACVTIAACADQPDTRLTVWDYQGSVVRDNGIECLVSVPAAKLDINHGDLAVLHPFTDLVIATPETDSTTWIWPTWINADSDIGEVTYSDAEIARIEGSQGAAALDVAEMLTRADWNPCIAVRVHPAFSPK